MIHASRELVWMMVGFAMNDRTTFTREFQDAAERSWACGGLYEENASAWGWWLGYRTVGADLGKVRLEHVVEIDCPRCLVAQDAAREGRVLT